MIPFALAFVALAMGCWSACGDTPEPSCQGAQDALLLADAGGGLTDANSPLPACNTFGSPIRLGALPSVITEVSGLVHSEAAGNRFWIHNDKGDAAKLYAVNDRGALLTTVTLQDVQARDWEDIAAGPCAGDTAGRACLYVGDIGDNDREHDRIFVHRLIEPGIDTCTQVVTAVETMSAAYPDGSHNAEALVVDEHGNVFIFTKGSGQFAVYWAPFSAGELILTGVQGAADLSSLPDGGDERVTAADYDPSRRRVLVRTRTSILSYQLGPDDGVSAIARVPFRTTPSAPEARGEAVAHGRDGYWHVSEGESAPLYFVPCMN